MSAKMRGFHYSISKWPKCWAKLSTRIRRAYPGIRYVLLPEQHKDGTLHTHAIMSAEITNTWISKNAHSSGLGYMSQSKPMHNSAGAAAYVSKYLAKTLGVEDWPPRFRRIRTSQKWPELIGEDDGMSIDVDWTYCATYPADGLRYLAEGLTERTGIPHIVL